MYPKRPSKIKNRGTEILIETTGTIASRAITMEVLIINLGLLLSYLHCLT